MSDFFESQLASIAGAGNLRHISGESAAADGLVDLSTNDYLGLADSQALRDEFYSRPGVTSIPMTAAASRLLASAQKEFKELEDLLRRLYDRDILLFNSGYHANTGIMSAVASGGALIVADRLVHASMIDGIVLSKARFTRFPHNDLDALERILDRNVADYERIVVAVESVYSMDGDSPDIARLIDIKRRYPGVILYVDEAHAVGVLGRQGLGLVNDIDERHEVDIIVGTFGKACASMGAFCATSPTIREFLVNRARSFIFSTALSPLSAAWTRFMIEKIVTMDSRRSRLAEISRRMASEISRITGTPLSPSHILPVVVGDPVKAVKLSQTLAERGYKVLPIRVPTVPPGTDRLRVSLQASLTDEKVGGFLSALEEVL